tara:strand:- start:259 stop:774 length:516 start_codon:yes stop_codon:yes gene_type:complete
LIGSYHVEFIHEGKSLKLYDGRGKRFKYLIDFKKIMKENRLKVGEVIPKCARASWYSIWLSWFAGYVFGMVFLNTLVSILWYFVTDRFVLVDEFADFFLGTSFTGFFVACIVTVFTRRKTWKSKATAIQALAQQGFCPNCGYIIRDTPADPDGCVPCSECGHAWRVEPVDS